MEGKRFGIGLAAGVLLALAIVTVLGGLGSTPFTAVMAPSAASTTSTTTVANTIVATATVTMTTTPIPQTTSSTSTLSIASTTSGGLASLSSNETYPYSISSSSTTVTSTASSVSSTTGISTPGAQYVATGATSGTPHTFGTPSGTAKPTLLASIARQPAVTNAEILAPVLVAFLLGAFLYRIAVQERERSSGE